MEEVNYILNFDYESSLAGKSLKFKGSNWFDHIFFFINQEANASLNSTYPFDEDYLNYLKELGVVSTKIRRADNPTNWWGKKIDLPVEKYFNSKITMTELGLREGWIPVQSTIDIEQARSEFELPLIARDEWGFSGRGVKIIRDERDFDSIKSRSVFSSYVKKIRDYGITFDLIHDDFFIVENFIDSRGQFKGGTLRSADESIGEKNLEKLILIRNKLKELGATDSVQIDTFTFDKGFHPFVEVNYRRTMGQMVYSLKRYFDERNIYWLLMTNKKKKSFKDIQEGLKMYPFKTILLSPADHFLSIALLSEKELNISNEISKLEKFIGQI
ncbi:hypothetical protein BIY24_14265 [Halobacteriovorax marinus]|uniref:hypothetical protein n=1 Tax=Halobacteriovorax marinus TaxID=97084 RepID=UPI000BC32508|nr:hypothetical protein [Halobacteriovorax marinus]ATH09065.1 hypothetical protein BIY24_14265 [Halobacteriovorax marinus]